MIGGRERGFYKRRLEWTLRGQITDLPERSTEHNCYTLRHKKFDLVAIFTTFS